MLGSELDNETTVSDVAMDGLPLASINWTVRYETELLSASIVEGDAINLIFFGMPPAPFVIILMLLDFNPGADAFIVASPGVNVDLANGTLESGLCP